MREVFAALWAGQFPNTHENHWVTKSGKRRLIAWTNTVLLDAAGAVEHVIGTGLDVTEQRQAEDRLRLVVSNAPIILFACGHAGAITLIEGQGLAALGHQPGSLVGQSVWAGAIAVPGLMGDLRRALTGEVFTATTEVRGAVFETHYAPQRDADGAVAGVIAVATDITERMRTQVALHRFETGLSPAEWKVLPLLARVDLRTYRALEALRRRYDDAQCDA